VDTLLNLIKTAVSETENKSHKSALTKSILVLEKLKKMEKKSNDQDDKECKELL